LSGSLYRKLKRPKDSRSDSSEWVKEAKKMNTWKLRLILIGIINLLIGIIFGAVHGYSEIIIGYIGVALLVTIVGIIWNPKEKSESA
jgi:hypothetical protein